MKARVVRRAPLALAYGCADDERLREVFAAMGAQVRVLKSEDWGTRLGVVFAYFTDALLDKALAALRTAQLAFDYKAALTPTNRTWTLQMLLEELKRERAHIEAQRGRP